MKWRALIHDLKAVFLRHFNPGPCEDPVEVKLLRMVVSLQKQRCELGELIRMQGSSEILEEFEQLRFDPAVAHIHTGKRDDPMFR